LQPCPDGNERKTYPGFQLFTILANGVVTTRKALSTRSELTKKGDVGKGLFAYGFPQTIAPEKVQSQRLFEQWEGRKAVMQEYIAIEEKNLEAAESEDQKTCAKQALKQ